MKIINKELLPNGITEGNLNDICNNICRFIISNINPYVSCANSSLEDLISSAELVIELSNETPSIEYEGFTIDFAKDEILSILEDSNLVTPEIRRRFDEKTTKGELVDLIETLNHQLPKDEELSPLKHLIDDIALKISFSEDVLGNYSYSNYNSKFHKSYYSVDGNMIEDEQSNVTYDRPQNRRIILYVDNINNHCYRNDNLLNLYTEALSNNIFRWYHHSVILNCNNYQAEYDRRCDYVARVVKNSCALAFERFYCDLVGIKDMYLRDCYLHSIHVYPSVGAKFIESLDDLNELLDLHAKFGETNYVLAKLVNDSNLYYKIINHQNELDMEYLFNNYIWSIISSHKHEGRVINEAQIKMEIEYQNKRITPIKSNRADTFKIKEPSGFMEFGHNISFPKPRKNFRELLKELMEIKGLTKTSLMRKTSSGHEATLSEKFIDRLLKKNLDAIKKEDIFKLCIALELNIDEATDLLDSAHHSWDKYSNLDIIICQAIDENWTLGYKKNYKDEVAKMQCFVDIDDTLIKYGSKPVFESCYYPYELKYKLVKERP